MDALGRPEGVAELLPERLGSALSMLLGALGASSGLQTACGSNLWEDFGSTWGLIRFGLVTESGEFGVEQASETTCIPILVHIYVYVHTYA